MKVFVGFILLACYVGYNQALKVGGITNVEDLFDHDPKDQLEDPSGRPKILTSEDLAVGWASNKPYNNGLVFSRGPGISKFKFNFNYVPDKHIKQIYVNADKDSVDVAYNDKDEDTNFYYQVKAVELPSGTKYLTKTLRGWGCDADQAIIYDPDYEPVLTSFDLTFLKDDHHIHQVKVDAKMINGWLSVASCFEDDDSNDYFVAVIGVALVPKTKLANVAGRVGCSAYSCGKSDVDSGGKASRTIDKIDDYRPALQAFTLSFQFGGWFGGGDHHLDQISVDLSDPDGAVHVTYQDKNADDGYFWYVRYVYVGK